MWNPGPSEKICLLSLWLKPGLGESKLATGQAWGRAGPRCVRTAQDLKGAPSGPLSAAMQLLPDQRLVEP